MSKLLPFLVAAAGASTVSVGGVYMLRQPSKEEPKPAPLTLYEDVSKFKESKGDSCVHELFGSALDMSSNSIPNMDTVTSTDASYFGDTNNSTSDTTKGCLIINWKKDNYKDSKWKGTFTWSWSFKNQKKGFIIFGVAKNGTTSKNLDLTGVAYLLEQDNETWTIKHHKDMTSGSKVSDSDSEFDKKLPKVGESIKTTLTEENDKSYWGFISKNTDLQNLCESTGCNDDSKQEQPKDFKWKWNWKQGGSQIIDSWCDKLEWWSKLFGTTNFDLSNKLSTFKGTWQKI